LIDTFQNYQKTKADDESYSPAVAFRAMFGDGNSVQPNFALA